MVRSDAGAPLITHGGHQLGTFRVFDKQAREYGPEQFDFLVDLVVHETKLCPATQHHPQNRLSAPLTVTEPDRPTDFDAILAGMRAPDARPCRGHILATNE